MESNVIVPASGSKFKLWLLIVVLAVAIFGGAAYGYYSWYKTNEPPPSLEMKDGTGLQGLMKIQEGDVKGFAKLEEGDVVTDCSGRGTTKLEGDTMDYLYSLEEVTLKDFYDSIAVKENVGRIFMFGFYSPGEEVGIADPTKYSTGFYLFPATETIYKASHVELKNLANYKIPAFRSVILWHSGTIDVCAGKVGPAFGIGKLLEDYTAILNENLKPLPKGYVLVPFGWNLDQVGVLKAKLGGYISSMWFKAGSGGDIKVKGEGLDGSLLEEAIESLKTRSVWLNVKKDKTDVVDIVNQEDDKLAPSIFKAEYNEGKGSQAVFVSFSEKVKDFNLDGLCKLKEPENPNCSGENLVKKEGAVKSADLKEGAVDINLQSTLEPGNYKVSFSKVSDFSGNVSGDISHIFKIDPIVKKGAGGACESNKQCEADLGCVMSENGGVCGDWSKGGGVACGIACSKDSAKCKVIDLKSDPAQVLCNPDLVKVCESDAGCDGGKKCVDVPKEYQEVAGGAKICAIPKEGKCDLNINCSPGLVCSKDKELGTSACVESECDVCGDLACTSLGDGGGFSSVTCGDVKDTKAPEVNIAKILAYPNEDWVVDISMSEAVMLPESKDFVTFCLLKEGTEKTCDGDAVKFISLGHNAVTDVAIDGTFDSSSVEVGKTYLVVVNDKVTDKAGNPVNLAKNFATVKITEADVNKCFTSGDVDADGKVDCKLDTLALLNIIGGKTPATPCADVNSDGAVNNNDLLKLTEMFCSSIPEVVTLEVTAGADQPPSKKLSYLGAVYDDVLSFDFKALNGDVTVKGFTFTVEGGGIGAVKGAKFDFTPDVAGLVEQSYDGSLVKFEGDIPIKEGVVQNVTVAVAGYNLGSKALNFSAKLSDVDVDGDKVVVEGVPLIGNEMTVLPNEVCTGGVDEDEDGKKDCLDEDCSADPSCTVGTCKVNADCPEDPNDPFGQFNYCASVDGGAFQCKKLGDFSSACPGNSAPGADLGKEPVFIDCETTIK